MWSPTRLSPASGSLAPGAARRLLPRAALACFCLLSLSLLAACAGYQLASSAPSILGDGTRTLKVKGVDDPTLHAWLPSRIRSALRDEIGARHLARWVDGGSADYEIQINVVAYTTRQWMRDELDDSVLYDASLTIEAVIYEGSSNKEVWRSGRINYSDRVEDVQEQAIAGDLITQTMRILADRMRNTF
ncbi:LPS assembly lipoprotein LptE [Desulfovibrio sp. OttesenSCG-928-A18]|nr:LPS assembly lipoprotein LptE [Desulfovibrio sp. OttesenSCG-928-A18]